MAWLCVLAVPRLRNLALYLARLTPEVRPFPSRPGIAPLTTALMARSIPARRVHARRPGVSADQRMDVGPIRWLNTDLISVATTPAAFAGHVAHPRANPRPPSSRRVARRSRQSTTGRGEPPTLPQQSPRLKRRPEAPGPGMGPAGLPFTGGGRRAAVRGTSRLHRFATA